MGSYASAAEPPPVTRQPTQSEAWLEEATRQLAEPPPVTRPPTQSEAWLEEATHQLADHRRKHLEKLSAALKQGCFKRAAVSSVCIFLNFCCLFYVYSHD